MGHTAHITTMGIRKVPECSTCSADENNGATNWQTKVLFLFLFLLLPLPRSAVTFPLLSFVVADFLRSFSTPSHPWEEDDYAYYCTYDVQCTVHYTIYCVCSRERRRERQKTNVSEGIRDRFPSAISQSHPFKKQGRAHQFCMASTRKKRRRKLSIEQNIFGMENILGSVYDDVEGVLKIARNE